MRTRLRAAQQVGAIALFVTEQYDPTNYLSGPDVTGLHLLNLSGAFAQITHAALYPRSNDRLRTEILLPALLGPGERLPVLDHTWFEHLRELHNHHVMVPDFPKEVSVPLITEFHVITPDGPGVLTIAVTVRSTATGMVLALPGDP